MSATILGMALIFIGVVTAQSKSMDGTMDKADDMATTKSMKHDDMKMKSDSMMKDDDMNMKKDEMMKDDDMDMKKS